MQIAVVSTSLSENSRSRLMATRAQLFIEEAGHTVDYIDLAHVRLPLCDGSLAYQHPSVAPLKNRLISSDAILLALPIYNYNIAASTKNFIELAGGALQSKVFGFICAAGSAKAYMSVLGLINSLIIDFQALIVPKFVFADFNDFPEDGTLLNESVEERIQELVTITVALSSAWKQARLDLSSAG